MTNKARQGCVVMSYSNNNSQCRRSFSIEYKLATLERLDHYQGEVGEFLRGQSLYYSQICEWRKLRAEGRLGACSFSDSEFDKKEADSSRISFECQVLAKKKEHIQALISDNSDKLAEAYSRRLTTLVKEMVVSEIEQLSTVIGIQAACKVTGFPRASYYRFSRTLS